MLNVSSIISLFMLLIQYGLAPVHAIVDGSNAQPGQFPFEVSLQNIPENNTHYCGGTIIHERFVLTSAHCVIKILHFHIRIVAGVTDISVELQHKNIRRVRTINKHPNLNLPLPGDNDLAIIGLDHPYFFDKLINKVTLAPPNYQFDTDKFVHISGWGLKKTASVKPSKKLKKAKVSILDSKQCQQKYYSGKFKKLIVGDNVFCTVHKNILKGKGICLGDSGGPVVTYKDKILVGVIEATYGLDTCGSRNYPDLHAKVWKYREWIDDVYQDQLSKVKGATI